MGPRFSHPSTMMVSMENLPSTIENVIFPFGARHLSHNFGTMIQHLFILTNKHTTTNITKHFLPIHHGKLEFALHHWDQNGFHQYPSSHTYPSEFFFYPLSHYSFLSSFSTQTTQQPTSTFAVILHQHHLFFSFPRPSSAILPNIAKTQSKQPTY